MKHLLICFSCTLIGGCVGYSISQVRTAREVRQFTDDVKKDYDDFTKKMVARLEKSIQDTKRKMDRYEPALAYYRRCIDTLTNHILRHRLQLPVLPPAPFDMTVPLEDAAQPQQTQPTEPGRS